MMVVITVSKCPACLRGDLSKWLIEIDTGVYVGNLSARVRDAVWDRICENIKSGRASMSFSSSGDQKLDFRIHNTYWEPVDYDGIKLVRRNNIENNDIEYKKSCKSAVNKAAANLQRNKKPYETDEYVAVDIKTTGLENDDLIIEIAAILVKCGKIEENFSRLIKTLPIIPKEISELTGITNELSESEGVSIKQALTEFLEFCSDKPIVGHNINFNLKYLQRDCINNGFSIIKNRIIDTMRISRNNINDIERYGLNTLAEYFGFDTDGMHRALKDAELTQRIYEKLKEI